MADLKLLAISGSLRAKSRNTALLREAVRLFGPADVAWGDLRLPLYDGDLEDAEGLPESVQVLVDQIREADAIIVATPEYNKMIPGVLKNALDWSSRAKPQPWTDKPVATISTAGRSGGEVAQYTLRHALAPFNANLLLGPTYVVTFADKAFDENDRLSAEANVTSLEKLMARLRASV
jgi:chromate reductase